MRDYIQAPDILPSIEELLDGRLKNFLHHSETIEQKRFTLGNLRALYTKDKEEFIKVVDEMTLRGFSVYTEKPNNILPTGLASSSRIILVNDNQSRFERLNYQSLGMSGFLQRFQIEDDRFFKYVPIAGFKKINRHLDINLLESELLKAGFSIHDLESDQIIEPASQIYPVNPDSAQGDKKTTPSIEKIFYENKFRTFVAFCKKKRISTIGELTDSHFDEYASMRGVGVGKVQAVKDLVKYNIEMNNGTEGSEMSSDRMLVEIEQVFAENVFRVFRRFCRENHIETVFDFTYEHLNEFADTKGVGITRVEAVAKRINEILQFHNKSPLSPDEGSDDLSISLSAVQLEVNTLFSEGRFTLFRDYCHKKGIITLGQLKNEYLTEYSRERMVGRKKLEEVRKVLSYYSDSTDTALEFFESGEIYELIQDFEVQELLYLYGFQSQTQSKLKVKDIEGKSLEELRGNFEPHLLISLSNLLVNQQTPNHISAGLSKSLSEREYGILIYRYDKEQTLEEVGGHFGVTRERVRQLAKKGVSTVVSYLRKENFSKIIKVLAPNGIFITGEELTQLIGEEHKFLVKLFKQEGLLFKYYEKLDLFFLEKEKNIDLKPIEDFFEELPEMFRLEEFRESFEEMLETLGIENSHEDFIQRIIEGEQYLKYGELYSRYRLPINDVLSYLFKHYISGPLKLDEEGAVYLQDLAKQKLDYDIGNTLRSVDARIRDAENVLLVDRATFEYFDSESFDQSIIHEVEHFLVESFKTMDAINVDTVFEHLRSRLEPLGINNKYHLYSLIRYYLDEKFTIGKGNTLNIFKNEGSKVTVEERLINFMKKNGGLCMKEQLLEVTKPLYKVDLAISHSDQIIPWGNNRVILVENLNLSAEEKSQLIQYFEQSFKKGYITVNYVFNEMMFDRKLSALLRNKRIDDSSKLTAIIKLLYPNVKGHTNFLYVEGSEFDSFEKVIESHFEGETTRQNIRDFAMEYGYKHMMASVFLKRLLEQGVFVEIDLDVLFPGKKLEVEEEALAEIKSYVMEEQADKEYLSLSKLQGYRRKLPYIGFRWNAHLLNSVLIRCGFRQVIKTLNDYRYDKIIVVKEESSIQSFEDLIVHILKNEYEGNMHEYAIYDFLTEKGVVREQDYIHDKNLPYEIKTSERFIFDELGNVSLR